MLGAAIPHLPEDLFAPLLPKKLASLPAPLQGHLARVRLRARENQAREELDLSNLEPRQIANKTHLHKVPQKSRS